MNKSFFIFCTYLLALFATTALAAYSGQEYDEKFVESISHEEGRDWGILSKVIDSDKEGRIIFFPILDKSENPYQETFRVEYGEYLIDDEPHFICSLKCRIGYSEMIKEKYKSIPGFFFDVVESTCEDEQDGDSIIFKYQNPSLVNDISPFWAIAKMTFHDSIVKVYTYAKLEDQVDQKQFDLWLQRMRKIQ